MSDNTAGYKDISTAAANQRPTGRIEGLITNTIGFLNIIQNQVDNLNQHLVKLRGDISPAKVHPTEVARASHEMSIIYNLESLASKADGLVEELSEQVTELSNLL